MKKLLLTVCCIIFITSYSKAQFDTIPNSGFENWYYTVIWTIEATSWQTNNSSIAAWNVSPDSTAHTGLLGLKIQNISYRGAIWSGLPLSQHPLTFDCFIKNGLNLGDTAFIRVHIYSSNVIVDSGYAEIYGGIGTNYLPFSVNISQNVSAADSCVITLEGGNMYMSTVSFDDLSFSFPTSMYEESPVSGWSVFPNPVTNELVVSSSEFGDFNEIIIFNMLGEKVNIIQPQTSNLKLQTVDVSQLPPGIYLLSVSYSKSKHNTIIIKN